MWNIQALVASMWMLAGGTYAYIPIHRTRDLIVPGREIFRPDRIVGGEEVTRGELPWQVSIQMKMDNKGQGRHFCGGTLISEAWVITAAHCTVDMDYPKDVQIVTGAYDLNEPNNVFGVKMVVRSNYSAITLKNDIALVKLDLDNPIQVVNRDDQKPTPVAVESTKEASAGIKCTISGWGRLASGGALPHVLRAADVQIRSDQECLKMFKNQPFAVHDTNVCAGGEEQDACQGDSGGPLVCCDDAKRSASCRIIGLTSWGIGCATRGLPGVYTEIAHYVDFIVQTITTEDGPTGAKELNLFRSNEL